jgi:hypothetical protein
MRRFVACVILSALSAKASATPIIDVSGPIDGSGVMEIDNSNVAWANTFFDTPTALNVNGVSWDPSTAPVISIPGPLLPTGPISDYFVNTDIISGRDIANAQVTYGQLYLYFCDTPSGADTYDVQVSFTPRPPPVPSPSATLQIQATIDGSDTLQITPAGLTWVHNYWSQPSGVTVNGYSWDTVDDPTLADTGATAFLPAGVDLSSVVFTKQEGRDTATYQYFPDQDQIDVYFGDNPGGSSQYQVTLSFGNVPEPASLTLLLAAVPLLGRRCGKLNR